MEQEGQLHASGDIWCLCVLIPVRAPQGGYGEAQAALCVGCGPHMCQWRVSAQRGGGEGGLGGSAHPGRGRTPRR